MPRHALPTYLLLRSRIYYFRFAVPLSLLPVFQRREYKKSLKTGDYKTACRAARRYTLFVERYFALIEAMRPSRDDIIFLIRNHFEKCLMLAEDDIWAEYEAIEDGSEDAVDVKTILAGLKEQHAELKNFAIERQYGQKQIQIADALLAWKGFELSPLDDLYSELAKGIMTAQIEAKRLHVAYLGQDETAKEILPVLLKSCRNYLAQPDFAALYNQRKLPYHAADGAAATQALSAAIEEYLQYKDKESSDWKRNRRAMLGRLQDFLGADCPLASLTEEHGHRIEAMLWRIPLNYVRDHESKGRTLNSRARQSFRSGDFFCRRTEMQNALACDLDATLTKLAKP